MWLAKSVIPECYIDSCLFNVLLQFGKDGVNHTKGNTTVAKKVKEKFDDLFCIAIIDKDRRDIDLIKKECNKIALADIDSYFLFFKRQGKHHYFIQIVPAIEEWIMHVARELNIDLSKTDLNISTIQELKNVTKKVTSKNDERFKSLFKKFVRKSEAINYVPVLKLKSVIKYLLEKKFDADLNELING